MSGSAGLHWWSELVTVHVSALGYLWSGSVEPGSVMVWVSQVRVSNGQGQLSQGQLLSESVTVRVSYSQG